MRDLPLFISTDNTKLPAEFAGKEEDFGDIRDCRIPALLSTISSDGKPVILAVADKANSGADWGHIEIAVRRSTDNGESFGKVNTVFSPPVRKIPVSSEDTSAAFAIDPILINAPDGKVIMLVDFFPECKGIHNKSLLEKCTGCDEIDGKMRQALFSCKEKTSYFAAKRKGYFFTVDEDGFVCNANGKRTNYYLPKNHNPEYGYKTLGDMYYAVGTPDYADNYPPLIPSLPGDGEDIYVGNIYLNVGKTEFSPDKPVFVQKKELKAKENGVYYDCIETSPAPLRAAVTQYVFCMVSTDAGKTFSQPYDITPMIKKKSDGIFCGTAPGTGLTLEYGKCKGRILAPMYSLGKACVIFSDDNGKTWSRGNDDYCKNIGECQLIQAPDENIYCFGRPPRGKAAPLSVSHDGGNTFEKLPKAVFNTVRCQKSVISVPADFILPDNICNDGSYFIVSSPSGHSGLDLTRTDGKISLCRICGNKTELIKEYPVTDSEYYSVFGRYSDFYAYSCLCILPDNSIGLLYEAYPSGYIAFRKIML